MTRLGLSDAAEDPGAAINGMVANAKVAGRLAGKFRSFLLNHRYLTLAACLNLPGNSALGGGGGIAFLCGLSGQFHWRRFILTVILATAPIPLLVLFGLVPVESLLERVGRTSAFGYKRTLLGTVIYFRFTPESGHSGAGRKTSVNDPKRTFGS